MSKGIGSGPPIGFRKAQTAAGSSSVRQTKAKEKTKEKAPVAKVAKPKVAKVHGSHKGAAHAEHHDEGVGEAGGLGLEGAEGVEGAHRHHGLEAHELDEEDEVEEHEDVHDTGATGADSIKRAQADSGGGDGFEGEKDQREAYERYMRGSVRSDQDRIRELQQRGQRDDFRPERSAVEVEALGVPRASAHVVRLYESWALDGVPREEAITRAADFLAGFNSAQSIRRVLAELESKPIRDVYPLEVLMKMLAARPELLPGVRAGAVIGNVEQLSEKGHVIAGRPTILHLPLDMRLKSFALLGGGRPGYEFHPHVDEGKYQLLIDTPGRWRCAILAVSLQKLGRIQKESGDGLLEIFDVDVSAMGKKGEPLSAQEWMELQRAANDDDDDNEGDGVDDHAENPVVEPAPLMILQIRRALDVIVRDAGGTGAATYSWDVSFRRPGSTNAEPLLHVLVDRAGPFDPAWTRAREALERLQREHEPGRALVTNEDIAAALRRARVRDA